MVAKEEAAVKEQESEGGGERRGGGSEGVGAEGRQHPRPSHLLPVRAPLHSLAQSSTT